MALPRKAPLPALSDLHQRHFGFYAAIAQAYADAAAICFSEFHTSPTDLEVSNCGEACIRSVEWSTPSDRAHASWANVDDATRDGAYSVSLATAEVELGFVALERADVRSGADYYVGPPGSDLEESYRLEVSGVRGGDRKRIRARLREKVEQAATGRSDRPAIACVVGFAARTIELARVDRDAEP